MPPHRCPRAAAQAPIGQRLSVLHPMTLALRFAVLGVTAGLFGGAPVALAQDGVPVAAATPARDYAIAPGPLASVLTRFSQEAGVFLVGAGSAAEGRTSPGLQGTYTAPEGLAALLAGTGLVAVRHGDGSYGLEPIPGPDRGGLTTLPAVQVSAAAPGPSELPEPYAGGQVARGGRVGMLGNVDVMDAPFNLTSYTAELMEHQQARSVSDVMANDPSVRSVVSAGSFFETLNVRGFTVGANDIGILGLYGLTPITRTTVEFAERIDVLKGPAAMLTGMPPSGGVGGTVAITPKRAADDPLTRVTAGMDYRNRPGVHLDLGRRFGLDDAIGIRVNTVVRGGEGAVRDEEQATRLGSIALDYRGDRLRLALDSYYQRKWQDGGHYGLTVLPYKVPDASRPLILGSRAHTQDKMALVSGEYDLTPAVTAFAKYGWHDTDVLGVRALTSNFAADGSFLGGHVVQNTHGEFRTGEAGVRIELDTGPVRHRIVTSVTDFRLDNYFASAVTAAGNFVPSNIFDPVLLPGPDGWPSDGERRKNREQGLRSVALADTLSVWDDRAQLTLGLRRQEVRADNFSTATGARTSHYDESAITPAAGLVFKPVENISLYANYAQGLTQGPIAPLGLLNAGEVFAPYKSRQYEVGAKGEWGGLGASVSLFQIERPNTLTQDNRFSVDGEQRNRGVELNVFGEPVQGLRVLGGLTFLNAKVTKAAANIEGNDAFGIPHRQVNLGVEWDPWFAPDVTLTARVLNTGAVYLNNANTIRIPAWTRWDIGARYALNVGGKPVTLRATVENLLDQDYWMANDVETWLSLSGPRTFMLSATVDF